MTELTTEEAFYLKGLIDQQLEYCKFTLTNGEMNFRFDIKTKLMKEIKDKK